MLRFRCGAQSRNKHNWKCNHCGSVINSLNIHIILLWYYYTLNLCLVGAWLLNNLKSRFAITSYLLITSKLYCINTRYNIMKSLWKIVIRLCVCVCIIYNTDRNHDSLSKGILIIIITIIWNRENGKNYDP